MGGCYGDAAGFGGGHFVPEFLFRPLFPGAHLPTSVPTLADGNIDKNTHAEQSS